MNLKDFMHMVSLVFEIAGVTTIVIGFGVALVCSAKAARSGDRELAYNALRQTFGRSILLGLEVLVAADLIRTIAVEPTLANLAVLAVLVAIRTFLSWSLELEIDGHWPWKRGEVAQDSAEGG